MYRNIVWCYLIVLTLLDISLNTKLSAQGKNHGNGVSVHESLMEGISLQEWGKESVPESVSRGRAVPPEELELSPPALDFGAAPLAEAHARTVTLTNIGNETIHLASVAGLTPDFHASFFQSKTLVPQANTTFSVVYLGRHEGPVSTHLYIHTSKGVLKYPVVAEGVASPWRVWPLVNVRVPLNTTFEPLLTMYNPTDTTIQVSEVYSSGTWLGLRLPEGGESAPREQWSLPPHGTRALVRLRVRAPPHHLPPRAAYIRIKANMSGGGLVVPVQARGAPPGLYLQPCQLRLRTRGDRDPPDTIELSAGNSEEAGVRLEAEVWGARCSDAPRDDGDARSEHARNNGARAGAGARVRLLRESLDAFHPLTPAAALTLDYGLLWAGAEVPRGGARGAWCSGWVRVGGASAPYSLRLLPGTLDITPQELIIVSAEGEAALAPRELHVHNAFPVPLHVHHVHFPEDVQRLFHTEALTPLALAAGARATAARLRLRAASPRDNLRARVSLHTNLSDYSVPLLLLDGRLHIEWEWWGAEAGSALDLGVVSAGSRVQVRARVRNLGPATLCVTALHTDLPAAAFQRDPPAPGEQWCIPGGAWGAALVSAEAGAGEGAVRGAAEVRTAHGRARALLSWRARRGELRARDLLLDNVAPYVRASAPLVLESTMSLRMRVTGVSLPPPGDPALSYVLPEEEGAREVAAGARAVGRVQYAAEAACGAACATGLEADSAEGAAWLARGATPAEEALPADEALLRARRALFPARAPAPLLLAVHTDAVRAVPAAAAVRWAWPTLARAPPAAHAPVAAAEVVRVRVRNPAHRTLLLQPRLSPAHAAFSLGPWHQARGHAAGWPPAAPPPKPYVALDPLAEIDLDIIFTPDTDDEVTADLYLRNNLTILETIPLRGRGAYPSFEVAGLKPNSSTAIVLEVAECGAGGAGTVRRTLVVRNTGAVAVRLRDWRVAGAPCLARGFRLHPCGALALAPNETRALTLAYTPDWTQARAAAALSVRLGAHAAAFRVAGAAGARLVARCARAAPRPPFEPALRAAGAALALVALALAAALAALDAERALRRARAARPPAPPAPAPLDLRALARPEPAPAPAPALPEPAPPRRRRPARRRGAALDAAAERRAFERWRKEVSRRPRAEDSRSSEDGDAPPPPSPPRGDASTSSPDSSPPPPRDSYSVVSRRASGDATSGSESSAGSEQSEPSEVEESPRRAPAGGGRSPGPTPPAPAPPARPRDAGATSRRESGSGRSSCGEVRPRTRSGGVRAGPRAERLSRRRSRAASPAAGAGAPAGPAGEVPGEARPPPGVRWGASWSSVVSRGAAAEAPPAPPAPAPLAPIGSDVRRRCGSHSLFYYGAAEPAEPRDLPWPAPPPPPPRPEYAEEGGFRSLESVWGASMEPHPAAVWLWGAGAVRPPPGFAARTYDPFHSLASIWTPATLDWRRHEQQLDDSAAPAAGNAHNHDSGHGNDGGHDHVVGNGNGQGNGNGLGRANGLGND